MSNVERILQSAAVDNRLTYLSAHKMAGLFYARILASHDATSGDALGKCVIFCFSHLSSTVNLSICNHWISIFENIYLIPKKSSLNTALLRHVANPTRILRARDRSDFKNTVDEIKGILSQSDLPVILFDIGGYFAPYIDDLSVLLGGRLRLVLEDTANGHIKYKNTNYYLTSMGFKSVAYDSYKMAENVMVANITVGHVGSFIPDWSAYRSILVVGYGRIGRSLCFGLRAKGVKNIGVVDIDNARLFMAATEGFKTFTRSQLSTTVDKFDYCFAMSGQHGVTPMVLAALKDNSYISVVTSYDDEFESSVRGLFESGDRETVKWNNKTINIINKGRPINLSKFAAFDARNLSLHFLFGRIFSSFLGVLGFNRISDWEAEVYADLLSEIQSS